MKQSLHDVLLFLKKHPFQFKLIGGFALILIVLQAIFYTFNQNNISFINSNRFVEHTREVLYESEQLFSEINANYNNSENTGTDNQLFYEQISQSVTVLYLHLNKLAGYLKDNEQQMEKVNRLTQLIKQRIDFYYQDDAVSDIEKSTNNFSTFEKIREVINSIKTNENSLLAQQNSSNQTRVVNSKRTVYFLEFIIILILIILFITIQRTFIARKKAEDNLIQSNLFLDTIFENIPDMIFVKDARDLSFVRLNAAGEKLLGFSRNELIGKNVNDFFSKEEADHFIAQDIEVLESGMLLNIPEEKISMGGEKLLHTKKIPIYDKNGAPKYLLGISEDITQQKQAEQLLIEANRELDAFTYSVSHDLRAPLRSIAGFSEILISDESYAMNQEAKTYLKIINDSASKMQQLIQELLAFSHIGKQELKKTKLDMEGMVQSITAEHTYKRKSGELEIELKPMISAYGDEGLIKQVVDNLISNAIKYSGKKEKAMIEIGSYADNQSIVYYVKDNGAGFDMKYYDKLFGVFQRLHSIKEFDGTGVGLSIVQRIINKHGGSIWAEGKVNEGAIFNFSLPNN